MSYPTEDAAFFAAFEARKLGDVIAAASTGAVVPLRGHLEIAAGKTVTAGYRGSQSTKLKIRCNGTDFFIPLNTA